MERCVVITGVAGGVGRALVAAFLEAGYHVIGLDIADRAKGLPRNSYIKADLNTFVEDEEYAATIIAAIKSAATDRAIAALINNAATQVLNSVENLSRKEWRTSLNINLQAPFFLSQALLSDLAMNGGSIVNISSIHARLTKPNFSAYSTSKAALSGMTRAMAVELGARVRVNAIEPAAIETEMLRASFERRPHKYQQLCRVHPTGAIGKPAELAALVLQLVDSSPFQTGSVVTLDGGIGSLLHDPDV